MLSIGIVDVTTVGSTICQRRICELGGANGDHPEFSVHSIPFIKYRAAINQKAWEALAELILISIEKLRLQGVSFVIIPSNTPHYAYEIISKRAKVAVLDLIEITANACAQAGIKKVAILGIMSTMTDGLYLEKITRRGMTLVIPEAPIREAIHQYLMEELIPGRATQEARQQVLELIKSIDCDGYILGCTELPEVYSSEDLGKPAIDTTRLLADVAFDIAIHEKALGTC